MGILEALKAAEKVKPIATKNGLDIVTFEDQHVLAQKELVDGDGLGDRVIDERGFPKRSRTLNAAINPDHLCINRYRLIGDEIQVVTDYRAIKEQSTGRVYLKSLPAYTIKRVNKELVLGKTVMVSDAEFIGEFTHTLNNASMLKILPLIAHGDTSTAEALPI